MTGPDVLYVFLLIRPGAQEVSYCCREVYGIKQKKIPRYKLPKIPIKFTQLKEQIRYIKTKVSIWSASHL